MRVPHALAAATALLGAAAAHAATVLFIATGNVPAGKFRQLAEIARPHGVTVEMRYVHRLPAEVDEGLFRGADAVFFDTYQIDEVRDRLARALPGLVAPHVWLYDARPAWRGGSTSAPDSTSSCALTSGTPRRSASTTRSPFGRVADCGAAICSGRGAAGGGGVS